MYRLPEPIDDWDGLTPLPDWLNGASPSAVWWALRAVLALADAGADIGWRGDMRHLPSVGAVLTPAGVTAFLVVKQDDNGITFVVSASDGRWIADLTQACVRVQGREIGAWVHPRRDDAAGLEALAYARMLDRQPGAEPAF